MFSASATVVLWSQIWLCISVLLLISCVAQWTTYPLCVSVSLTVKCQLPPHLIGVVVRVTSDMAFESRSECLTHGAGSINVNSSYYTSSHWYSLQSILVISYQTERQQAHPVLVTAHP